MALICLAITLTGGSFERREKKHLLWGRGHLGGILRDNFQGVRAKGAAKGSCGETVVQKGVFGESVSSLPP